MKIQIRVFDELELVLDVARDPRDDELVVGKSIIVVFLNRPGRPHITLFTKPRRGTALLEPHFTAYRGNPKQFRGTLARFAPESVPGAISAFTAEAAARFFGNLERADLDAMTRDCWRVHYVNYEALLRWIEKARDYRLDYRTMAVFVRHVLRRKFPPKDLPQWEEHPEPIFIATRVGGNGTLEARHVCHMPCGFVSERDGERRIFPAGWYYQPIDPSASTPEPECLRGKTSVFFERLNKHLGRYRYTPVEHCSKSKDWVDIFPSILGRYSSLLMRFVVLVEVERRQRRKTG